MLKVALLTGAAMMVIGCGSSDSQPPPPPAPKPTAAEVEKMAPEAQKHAAEMDAYAKSQAEMNQRMNPNKK
jgi:hypothetical protein